MSVAPNTIRIRAANSSSFLLLAGAIGTCILLGGCLRDPFRIFAAGRVDADVGAQVDADVAARLDADANVDAQLSVSPKPTPVRPSRLPFATRHEGPAVVLVDVDGVLMDADSSGLGSRGENTVAAFREKLDAIESSQGVCAVVIRINTYGGSVTASDIMWRDLRAFRKRTNLPVVACLMDVATGGGYYLATAADNIVAHPTTITGGIGCILNLYNVQDLMAQFNIVSLAVKSGPKIDLGTPTHPLDDENRSLLQQMCDEFHERFRELVIKSRPVDPANQTLFDGRVFTGPQAQSLGLVDKVGYLDDAVAIGRKLGNAPAADVISFRHKGDEALSTYAITPNVPLQDKLIPVNIPGLDRARLPAFLYMWLVEPSSEKMSGK